MNQKSSWLGYACAPAAAMLCTLVGVAMTPRFDVINIAMVYLLAVVLIALYFSRGAAILSSLLCVGALDYKFVPPRGALTVDDAQYLLTFAILLTVALVIAGLRDSRLRQAEARAALIAEAETERIRSTLLASISHDLRAPLAVMTGASSTLVERGDQMNQDERKELARSIYGRALDMSEQVAKVLQMTRLESGAVSLERDWTAMSEIAGAVLSRLSTRLSEHRILVDIPAELPLVRVDAPLIEQVLANLLENAARHTPPGTVVRLKVQPERSTLTISVEDFGPGIDEKDVERVFAKFHRGTIEDKEGGVGLGLAICRSIVTLHKGNSWAESLSEGGTAFRFTLPLEPQPKAPDSELVSND